MKIFGKNLIVLVILGVSYLASSANAHTIIQTQTKQQITTTVTTAHTNITLYPGSLRNNIQRIATQYGWKQVIWNAPYDYNWTGTTHIRAANLASAMQKILSSFPLQAIFYQGNRVLAIQPRTLK